MRRAWLALLPLCGACLVVGEPSLAKLDSTPPTVTTSLQAGVALGREEAIELTFSEAMELRSLRPGINVERAGEPLGLDVKAELAVESFNDIPFRVLVRPGVTPLPDGGSEDSRGRWLGNTDFELILRPLLIDTQGNALQEEQRIDFRTGP